MKKTVHFILACSLVFIASQSKAAYFGGLGDLANGDFYSVAHGVSDDGQVAAGWSPYEAFRWTPSDGMEGLGYLDIYPGSGASAVSGDGLVIVGSAASSMSFETAVRWTAATGIEAIPFLDGGYDSHAYGVNQDGSAVVGGCTSFITGPDYQAFIWTEADGTQGLGTLKGHNGSRAYGVSADGLIVAGTSWSWTSGQEAFRWTAGGEMEGLGVLPGYLESGTRDVSADGKTIVGTCLSDHTEEAFRWRAGSEAFPGVLSSMEGLGDLPGGDFASRAYGVSGDGKVVVGVGNSDLGDEAVIWFGGDLYHLKAYLLEKLGLPVKGWKLTAATDISADGKTIVGFGTNPDGETEAWIANLEGSQYPILQPPTGLRVTP